MFSFLSDARDLLRGSWAAVRARRVFFFIVLPVLAISATLFFFPRDAAISDWVYQDRSEFIRDVARRFSAYGDFRLTLELFIAFLVLGVWKKRRKWQRLGIAVMLAGSLAGVFDSSIRLTTGRPRPSAKLPDHFTGPNLRNSKMQSFPSAHSATSMATATVIAVAVPSVGIPFFIFSMGVPWSRVYMHDHYMSDITVGSLIGVWFGLAFGLALRKLNAPDKFQ